MATKASPPKTPARKAAAAKATPKAPAAKAAPRKAAKSAAIESGAAEATPAEARVKPARVKAVTPKAAPPSKLKTAATALTPDPLSIAMLKEDHRAVSALFKAFKTATRKRKLEVAREASQALKVHTTIEEEIFYPAIKARIEEGMVNEAVVEHASAKDLIAQLDGMNGSEELFDARVIVLSEMIEHHVHEEEAEMFKQAKASGVDLEELGERMAARKAQLEKDPGFSVTGWLKGLTGR